MKFFIVCLALAAVASADVSHLGFRANPASGPDAAAQILKQDVDVFPDQYHYAYETSNGIAAQENGQLKNVGSENEAIAVEGSSSYVAPDGSQIAISYVADENGYQPYGAHLPTTPAPQPIPDYILRAIKYIEEHPPKTVTKF